MTTHNTCSEVSGALRLRQKCFKIRNIRRKVNHSSSLLACFTQEMYTFVDIFATLKMSPKFKIIDALVIEYKVIKRRRALYLGISAILRRNRHFAIDSDP